MRTLVSACAALSVAAAAWASDAECKYCADEVVVRASQLDCLRQKIDEAAREIGDRKTVLIDLLNCGAAAGGGTAPSTRSSPPAPPPIAGAPTTDAPAQVYRLTRAGLECVQRRLSSLAPGQDPIRIATSCA